MELIFKNLDERTVQKLKTFYLYILDGVHEDIVDWSFEEAMRQKELMREEIRQELLKNAPKSSGRVNIINSQRRSLLEQKLTPLGKTINQIPVSKDCSTLIEVYQNTQDVDIRKVIEIIL